MKKNYENVYGTWTITTEDDVEGKTIKYLGTFTGCVDEIALHLADKSYYTLIFKNVKPIIEYVPKKKEVHVQFDDKSGIWDNIQLNEIRDIFKDRPVDILNSNYYKSFKIISNDASEIIKQNALDKLTYDEKEVLGLI